MTLHHCGSDHFGNTVATADCDVSTALLADLVAFADSKDVDPAAAREFWFKMRATDDPVFAARAVRGAIRAGWVPGGAA